MGAGRETPRVLLVSHTGVVGSAGAGCGFKDLTRNLKDKKPYCCPLSSRTYKDPLGLCNPLSDVFLTTKRITES